ncbi:MAG: glutathione S-transferase N-terminal domain-containing protein [Alphaproteobacteria bacterium]|nr:glutathione S-transferase N-terminal domain-containing protein [Alphaproteobacteria bacterium]
MCTLYYFPGNASLLPHMMLREIGAAFRLRPVDRRNNEQQSEAYLRLNPSGRIPVLIDGDLVPYEAAAIALTLVERHPEGAVRVDPHPGPLPQAGEGAQACPFFFRERGRQRAGGEAVLPSLARLRERVARSAG